jgi:hypothetical protein
MVSFLVYIHSVSARQTVLGKSAANLTGQRRVIFFMPR